MMLYDMCIFLYFCALKCIFVKSTYTADQIDRLSRLRRRKMSITHGYVDAAMAEKLADQYNRISCLNQPACKSMAERVKNYLVAPISNSVIQAGIFDCLSENPWRFVFKQMVISMSDSRFLLMLCSKQYH